VAGMNDRDINQILGAFLDLGPDTAPDRVGAAARREARETRQTMLPSWWPSWRFPIMNSTVRYGIGALAVIVIALAGINYLAPGGLGGPGATATPTSEPSRTPIPTVNPGVECIPLNPDASLAVDRYCVDVGDASPVEITFDIPNIGWSPYVPTDDFATLLNGFAWGLTFVEIDNLYADPCHPDAGVLEPRIGPTVDDLVAALREQPRFEVSDQEKVSIGGYTGQQLDVSTTYEEADCRAAESSWGVAPSGFATGGSMVPTPDRPVRFWIGDVDGTRLVITRPLSALPSLDEWASGIRDANRHAQDLLELDSIVESLRFND
jgi:hypothetical protein